MRRSRPVETFTEAREFVGHPRFSLDRRDTLATLDPASVDEPIVDIVAGFASLPHCFTLQCCYGHFVCAPGQDPHSLERIPESHVGLVKYRIAYIALCLEDSPQGRSLRRSLERVAAADPEYVQFGSADWFWERWVDSYVLQVEPVAHRFKDAATLEPAEARRTERVRDRFFDEIRALLAAETGEHAGG
jgi:hypothetical protein